jgi:hypothetical protein
MGRSDGRQWGLSEAAYGEISMAAVTQSLAVRAVKGMCEPNICPRIAPLMAVMLAGRRVSLVSAPRTQTCEW